MVLVIVLSCNLQDVTHKCELNLPKVNDIIKTDSVKKLGNAVVFYYCIWVILFFLVHTVI